MTDDEIEMLAIGFKKAFNLVPREELVKLMVDNFLKWQLPKDFSPDGGVKFTPPPPGAPDHMWPVGTNIFNAEQAELMIEQLLTGVRVVSMRSS